MPVDDEHVEYTKRKKQWEKLRDCIAGQEAVHEKGKKYLAPLSGQTNEDYKAYKERALFYGATSRTVDGLSGMLFRKAPTVEIPKGLEPYVEDITLDGLNLTGFAESVADEGISVGRGGILVDHPHVEEGVVKSVAERQNLRPFLKFYDAESAFNWCIETRNNAQVLTQVRLWEVVPVQGEDEFDMKYRTQIRVLDLDESGYYRQRVYIEKEASNTSKREWVQDDSGDVYPLMNNQKMTAIPFFFVGVKNGSAMPEKPPLIELANANISHYKSTADLEHGAHFTGLPTAVITGHSEDPEDPDEWRIGASNAWAFPNPETNAFYLEFQGQGLQALENRISKKEEYMAFLGARMLSPEKRGVETAEVAQIHRHGETSILASISASVSQSIQDALTLMSEWSGFDGDVKFDLNKEFLAIPMSAQQLQALLATWQSGGMAYADLLDNMKRGEIIRQDRSEDEILSEIETENAFDADGDINDSDEI